MYEATILADSVAPHGVRLTTFSLVFPRNILAEFNTHRMLSRNSSSLRAIPPEKIIEQVKQDPVILETFNSRIKGMGVGAALNTADQITCKQAWLHGRDKAVQLAYVMMDAGAAKSQINDLLAPFVWQKVIVSGTDWSNFFALRDNSQAKPEFQILARLMREVMDASSPVELGYGDWHLPLLSDTEQGSVDDDGDPELGLRWAHVSAGRCFKVSYNRVTDDEDPVVSEERARSAPNTGHWSPLEHPAMAVGEMNPLGTGGPMYYGNFCGWRQLRKFYPMEDDFQKSLDAVSVEI